MGAEVLRIVLEGSADGGLCLSLPFWGLEGGHPKGCPHTDLEQPCQSKFFTRSGAGPGLHQNSGPRARCLVGGFPEGTILGSGERGEETTDLRPPGEELMGVIASLRWSSHHQSPDGESQQGSPWGP